MVKLTLKYYQILTYTYNIYNSILNIEVFERGQTDIKILSNTNIYFHIYNSILNIEVFERGQTDIKILSNTNIHL